MSNTLLLEAKGLTKRFGTLVANDKIDIKVESGKIHALLGENGAGKSTLVKMFYGSLQPNAGQIFWNGEQVLVDKPSFARQLGVGMVFQHFSLFEALTVVENISLAMPSELRGGDLGSRIEKLSADYGLPLKPDALVADLSVGERQRIEIVRCLLQEPKLLIMDEPTAVLTPQEAESLFKTLRRLTSEGCAVLYISHRLEEVKKICHDVTILRHGKVVAQVDPQHETAGSLANLMVGSEIHTLSSHQNAELGDVLLETNDLSQLADTPFGVDLKKINISVQAGEILAIAGVAGNGQSELFSALSGERKNEDSNSVVLNGKQCGCCGIDARRLACASFMPEERIGHGAIGEFKLTDNVLLSRHALSEGDGTESLLGSMGVINKDVIEKINVRVCEDYDVRKNVVDPEAGSLSGGNLQKFVVGREIDRAPKVLIANQPTWGVDAGAAALIRQALIDLSRSGSALLVISQDLDEVFELADRIAVISRGEMSQSYDVDKISLEEIGLLMAGAHEGQEA